MERAEQAAVHRRPAGSVGPLGLAELGMEVTSDASDSIGGDAATAIIAAAAGAGETVHPDQAQHDEIAARQIRFKIACKAGCSGRRCSALPHTESEG